MDPLLPDTTTELGRVRHRLALGVQWLDALSRLPAQGRWISELQAIGPRACVQRPELHPQARHALRHAGRLARVLERAAQDKDATPPATPEDDPTNFVLQAWGERQPLPRGSAATGAGYLTGNDPRRYVPRRLSLTPAQAGGIPSAAPDNVRRALLWPGAGCPVASGTTALRGRVRRGPVPDTARPVAWARLVATRPGPGAPNFATETALGFAHGDDRGEFLLVLGPEAVPGGVVLPATLPLRLWVFLPPADTFDAEHPLASLPLEVAGTAAANAVLDGTAVPAGYLPQAPLDLAPAPGRVFSIPDAELRFG